jgi:hypothetical protein
MVSCVSFDAHDRLLALWQVDPAETGESCVFGVALTPDEAAGNDRRSGVCRREIDQE